MVPHLACFVQGRDPEREDVSGAITGYTSSTRYSVRFYRLCTVHAHAQFHFVRTSLFLHAVHTMRTPCVSDAHNVRILCVQVLLDNGTTKRYIWAHQIRVERKRPMKSK